MAKVKDYRYLEKTENGIISHDDETYHSILKRRSVDRKRIQELETVKSRLDHLEQLIETLTQNGGQNG